MDEMIILESPQLNVYYVGVTGHRFIEDEDLIRSKVRVVLEAIEFKLSGTDHIIKVISPLAEGADRIVAQEVLFFHGCPGVNEMRVVLPLEMHDYMNDFKTIESKMEFEELTDLAREIVTLKEAPTRKDAYYQVGKYVVEECNVLIAIWDGEPSRGKGGTAEIVDYAKSIGREVVWINSQTGEITIINE